MPSGSRRSARRKEGSTNKESNGKDNKSTNESGRVLRPRVPKQKINSKSEKKGGSNSGANSSKNGSNGKKRSPSKKGTHYTSPTGEEYHAGGIRELLPCPL